MIIFGPFTKQLCLFSYNTEQMKNLEEMKWSDVRFDCLYYRGDIPCKPHKTHGEYCANCNSYKPISKRILIIKLGAIGDVIRTTPLLTRYRELYPDCHITWITQSPAILPKDQVNVILNFDFQGVFKLGALQFDLAINLDKDIEACHLLDQANATEKIGYIMKDGHVDMATPAAEAKLLTGSDDRLSKANQKTYQQEAFEICGLEYKGEHYIIPLNEGYATKWTAEVSKLAEGKKVVGLNTGYGFRWPTRAWPTETWTELVQQLHSNGYFCVILGGKQEDAFNTQLAASSGAYYPGHYSLEEFIAVINACDLMVTQVTMALHLALGLRKKLVLMNNIFNPYEFDLYGLGVIEGPPAPCQCYFSANCKGGFERSCMQSITANQIFTAIEKVFALPVNA